METTEKGTTKLNLGELKIEQAIGPLYASLMERLVLYEALIVYKDLLQSGTHKSKIKNCMDRIDNILKYCNHVSLERFISMKQINIEDILNWAESDFQGEISLSVNTDTDSLPF